MIKHHMLSAAFFLLASSQASFSMDCLRVEKKDAKQPAMPDSWLIREDFSDASWQERWVVETQGALVESVEGGGLRVDVPEGVRNRIGTTVWLIEELPDDVIIRVKARTLEADFHNACNLNLMVHAREIDGSPYAFGRSGDYPSYHSLPNYILTFTGGDAPGWARLRRNPGFNKVSEYDIRTEPGKNYELIFLKEGPRLRQWINGEPIHDFEDSDPLPGGRFGLRTFSSHLIWESVEIATPDAPSPAGLRRGPGLRYGRGKR